MKLKISFVIPVYNGIHYLGDCIDSIFNQGLQEDSFEVICVDDCSTDGSLALLQQYADKHPNIRIIAHERNMKIGTSCSHGFQAAQGEYIWTIDQDDWIEKNKTAHLLSIAETENLDVLLFNYKRVNATGTSVISHEEVFKESDVMDGRSYTQRYFNGTVGVYLMGYGWRAFYRREALLANGIRFPEGVIYEDTTFLFKAIWYAERVKSISDYVYNYRLNNFSITDYKNRYKGYMTYEFSFGTSDEMITLANEIGDEFVASQLRDTAYKSMKSFVYKVVPMPIKEKNIFYEQVAQSWEKILPMVKALPLSYRILLCPNIGKLITVCLKPLFILKHLVKK